jgi:hypothetical protein
MAVVEGERNAEEFDTDAENTQDANDVKAVLWPNPHSRNTIVGLSLPGLSLIFKGQRCSKGNKRATRNGHKKSDRPASSSRQVKRRFTEICR